MLDVGCTGPAGWLTRVRLARPLALMVVIMASRMSQLLTIYMVHRRYRTLRTIDVCECPYMDSEALCSGP